MIVFHGPREHYEFAFSSRRKAKPLLRRTNAGQLPNQLAQPPNFDPQSRTMRSINESGSERFPDEHVPRYISRPRFAQRPCEREQDRTPCE
jgi:hypothetical protein